MNIASAQSLWPTGPFSAVRPGERPNVAQEPVESSGPEPVDELISHSGAEGRGPVTRGPNTQELGEHGRRSAGSALAAFPQIVHLLANPELHLGQTLAVETGLPVVSLQQTNVEELGALLARPLYAGGFILEGFPADRASAEELDGLFSATDPIGRRVLSFDAESDRQQEVVDHYVDQGLLWQLPSLKSQSNREETKNTLLECLSGLPAVE